MKQTTIEQAREALEVGYNKLKGMPKGNYELRLLDRMKQALTLLDGKVLVDGERLKEFISLNYDDGCLYKIPVLIECDGAVYKLVSSQEAYDWITGKGE